MSLFLLKETNSIKLPLVRVQTEISASKSLTMAFACSLPMQSRPCRQAKRNLAAGPFGDATSHGCLWLPQRANYCHLPRHPLNFQDQSLYSNNSIIFRPYSTAIVTTVCGRASWRANSLTGRYGLAARPTILPNTVRSGSVNHANWIHRAKNWLNDYCNQRWVVSYFFLFFFALPSSFSNPHTTFTSFPTNPTKIAQP